MDEIIYSKWLTMAPIAYVILGCVSMFTTTPKSKMRESYRVAKILFALILFFMGGYIASLGLFDFRSNDLLLAQSLNISSFFGAAQICGYIFMTLLGRSSDVRAALLRIFVKWAVLTSFLAINYFVVSEHIQPYFILVFSLVLLGEVTRITITFFKEYKLAQRRASDYYSDNIHPFIESMQFSLYSLLAIGFFGCTHAYYPPLVNTIYGVIAMIILTIVVITFRNYINSLADIHFAFEPESESSPETEVENPESNTETAIQRNDMLKSRIEQWINEKGYTQASITSEELARIVSSNRTYLSSYIRSEYKISYRDWIASLRIEYSKELMMQDSKLLITNIAEAVGYNRSSFTKAFIKENGISPARWSEQQSSDNHPQGGK